MGKGFNNFMSKKDFHPAAIWNLKKVWEAQQKVAEEQKKQDQMRTQYEKEQELYNNKALLGDEKAKIGLAFMYETPTGLKKDEPTQGLEPKFEWQRKYNAPRESWAKGDEAIQDQPFGIEVRNVRCVRCHVWGHANTDRTCPLYNMSGNHENAGTSTNPSDLIREMRQKKGNTEDLNEPSASSKEKEKLDPRFLNAKMKSEYGLQLKRPVFDNIKRDDALQKINRQRSKDSESSDKGAEIDQRQLMGQFLATLSDKERAKIFEKFAKLQSGGNVSSDDSDEESSSSSSRDERKKRREKHGRKSKKHKKESSKSKAGEDRHHVKKAHRKHAREETGAASKKRRLDRAEAPERRGHLGAGKAKEAKHKPAGRRQEETGHRPPEADGKRVNGRRRSRSASVSAPVRKGRHSRSASGEAPPRSHRRLERTVHQQPVRRQQRSPSSSSSSSDAVPPRRIQRKPEVAAKHVTASKQPIRRQQRSPSSASSDAVTAPRNARRSDAVARSHVSDSKQPIRSRTRSTSPSSHEATPPRKRRRHDTSSSDSSPQAPARSNGNVERVDRNGARRNR